MISTKQINNVKVKPVKIAKTSHNIKGSEMFDELYFNALLIARTKSGKTTTLYNIMKNTVDDRTAVYIFSSTYQIDPVYTKMINMLLKKCEVFTYDSFVQGGQSILRTLLDDFETADTVKEEEEEEVIKDDAYYFKMAINPPEAVVKKKKKVYTDEVPKRVMIFDDLSCDLKHPDIYNLLFKSRHYLTRVFVSCHDVVSLMPSSLNMINYILLFGGISDDRIIELADKCEIAFKEDKKGNPFLLQLYKQATAKPYSFLYIRKLKHDYRINFDRKFEL